MKLRWEHHTAELEPYFSQEETFLGKSWEVRHYYDKTLYDRVLECLSRACLIWINGLRFGRAKVKTHDWFCCAFVTWVMHTDNCRIRVHSRKCSWGKRTLKVIHNTGNVLICTCADVYNTQRILSQGKYIIHMFVNSVILWKHHT